MKNILEEIQSKIDNPEYLINSVEFGKSGEYITLGVNKAKIVVSELSRLQSENNELRNTISKIKTDLPDAKIRELNPIWVRDEIVKLLTNK